MPRILSLLPAATDIVVALGRADDLVGVTWECTVPDGLDVPVVTRNLLEVDDPNDPAQVDAAVQKASAAQEPLAAVDDDAIAAADPDVVLSQDLCRVCALPAGTVDEALQRLGCGDATLVSLDPMTVADVLATISTVGAAIGAEAEAATLIAELRGRLNAITHQPINNPDHVPTVLVVEWVDPLFAGGHWIPDMVTAAGGRSPVGTPGARSEPTSWDAVADVALDHVVVAPCGFDLAGACEQARSILPQVPGDTIVWAIDADELVVRPGPRLVEGVEVLADAIAGRPVDETRIQRIR